MTFTAFTDQSTFLCKSGAPDDTFRFSYDQLITSFTGVRAFRIRSYRVVVGPANSIGGAGASSALPPSVQWATVDQVTGAIVPLSKPRPLSTTNRTTWTLRTPPQMERWYNLATGGSATTGLVLLVSNTTVPTPPSTYPIVIDVYTRFQIAPDLTTIQTPVRAPDVDAFRRLALTSRPPPPEAVDILADATLCVVDELPSG